MLDLDGAARIVDGDLDGAARVNGCVRITGSASGGPGRPGSDRRGQFKLRGGGRSRWHRVIGSGW